MQNCKKIKKQQQQQQKTCEVDQYIKIIFALKIKEYLISCTYKNTFTYKKNNEYKATILLESI